MPVRFTTEPLGCLIYGGEGGLVLAVMAAPCELQARRRGRWTKELLLRHLKEGRPCPPQREALARELKRLGWIYRPKRNAWALTPAGLQHLNED